MKLIRLQMKSEMDEKRINRLKEGNDSLTRQLDREKTETDTLSKQIDQNNRENSLLTVKLKLAEERNLQLSQELENHAKCHEALKKELAETIAELKEQTKMRYTEEQIRRKTLEDVYASASWKVGNALIRPFSRVKKAIRRR